MLSYLLRLILANSLVLAQNSENLLDDERQGREGTEVGSVQVSSQVLDVVTGKGAVGVVPTTINTVEQEPSRFQPYRNTYQKHQQQPVLRDNKPAYSQSNLNILSFPSQGEVKRPTLESIASHAAAQGREVTTPQQLLDMCCQFPACYDPLYQLCIDTCRKCEQVFPVTSWLPCPPLLNIPDCTSPNLSWMGSLPLACYPDIGPFGNIMPLNSISAVSKSFGMRHHQQMGRNGDPGGNEDLEQSYRASIMSHNRKDCTSEGICRSSTTQTWANQNGY